MNASKTFTKSVAIFEAVKGTLVLLAGFGALSLLNKDVRVAAAALFGRMHVHPPQGFADSFLTLSNHLSDTSLWLYACLGFAYAGLRYLEAYGLWKQRRWAEWLAAASGTLFIPVEIYELVQKSTWIRVSALVVNIAIVLFMFAVIQTNKRVKT